MTKKQILKIVVSVLIAALTALGAAIGLNSCNVVRTVTNKSEYYQRGDTSVVIQTKTTESYDAKKNLVY
jgi:S-adenosylhomocysteine hydrolase